MKVCDPIVGTSIPTNNYGRWIGLGFVYFGSKSLMSSFRIGVEMFMS